MKRLLSILLSSTLLVTLVPSMAMAQTEEEYLLTYDDTKGEFIYQVKLPIDNGQTQNITVFDGKLYTTAVIEDSTNVLYMVYPDTGEMTEIADS